MIPELTKEVNEGKNFAQLRQVYNSLILATWYKKKIKDSILTQVYENKNKVAGINIDDSQGKQKIYERYLQAFKKGAYNYIKEEIDPVSQKSLPRKYFSGGIIGDMAVLATTTMPFNFAEHNTELRITVNLAAIIGRKQSLSVDQAMSVRTKIVIWSLLTLLPLTVLNALPIGISSFLQSDYRSQYYNGRMDVVHNSPAADKAIEEVRTFIETAIRDERKPDEVFLKLHRIIASSEKLKAIYPRDHISVQLSDQKSYASYNQFLRTPLTPQQTSLLREFNVEIMKYTINWTLLTMGLNDAVLRDQLVQYFMGQIYFADDHKLS